MKLSLRVRELINQHGWSAEQLASQAGLDSQTAQSLYTGQPVDLDMTQLSRLSMALGVTPPEIVDEVHETQPSIAEAPSPRDPAVDVQTMDQVQKAPPEPNAGI